MTDEYWNRGTKALDANHAMLMRLVESFPDDKRVAVKKMLEGPIGEQYMMAPASTRKAYHYAFPGGLLMHSLNVVTNSLKLSEALAPGRWPKWKVIFCALFHDLGKAGDEGNPYYIQTEERWKRERGEYYEVNKVRWMPSAEKGLYVLANAGVPVDHEEYLAIRLNDGPYEEANRSYSFREPPLAHVVHWADMWSTISEKEQG